ncbi:hypothetical protein CSH63_17765 [Micromonospora tulbaghiae]|uniref:Uncharacterized protein n=1 Tax=Micromonospora tulbaghiae TaxID=479978 RepID=A0A386WNN8_9ACTN|nr:hypothetical protein [Micromonospora tulbaghiae]AYF29278.1 hypothetical protein CSH63_17765 [Micromonospora tulbaghiae]
MTESIPPYVTASVDQARAELADVVRAVREHVDAEMCELPSACPGMNVAVFLAAIGPVRRRALLYVALAELAALDYGAPVHLTEAALAALTTPPRPPWWRRLMPRRRGGHAEK